MKFVYRVLGLIPVFCLCAIQAHANEDLDSLVSWLEGSFSNERQAKVDTSYKTVHINSTRILADETDGYYFVFVINELHDSVWVTRDVPVFRARAVEEGMFEIQEYRFKDTVVKREQVKMDKTIQDTLHQQLITKDMLVRKKGCELYLQSGGVKLFGGTHGTACVADVPGASYVTVDVIIAQVGMYWNERTYNSMGEQVAGPTKGPYAFFRTPPSR